MIIQEFSLIWTLQLRKTKVIKMQIQNKIGFLRMHVKKTKKFNIIESYPALLFDKEGYHVLLAPH